MTFIRGRSDSPDLEIMSGSIHALLFAYKTWIFWEWIPSKSMWTDSIIRLGWEDPWYRRHHFSPHLAPFPAILWRLPLAVVIRTAYFQQMHWGTVSNALAETRYLEWSQVISGLTVTVAAISRGRADRSVGMPNA